MGRLRGGAVSELRISESSVRFCRRLKVSSAMRWLVSRLSSSIRRRRLLRFLKACRGMVEMRLSFSRSFFSVRGSFEGMLFRWFRFRKSNLSCLLSAKAFFSMLTVDTELLFRCSFFSSGMRVSEFLAMVRTLLFCRWSFRRERGRLTGNSFRSFLYR